MPLKNIWVTTESAAHGKSTDFHHEIKPSLKQPEISGKRVLHSKYSLCCSVTAESSFAVAGFEAQLTNCYWANRHHSRSIPGGTEALPHHGEAPILPPLFPRLCKKMANKHRTFFSPATFPSYKEWLQTSADPPFLVILGRYHPHIPSLSPCCRKTCCAPPCLFCRSVSLFYLVTFCLLGCVWLYNPLNYCLSALWLEGSGCSWRSSNLHVTAGMYLQYSEGGLG